MLNKNTMISAVVAVVLLAGYTVADNKVSPEEYCESRFNNVSYVMNLRQNSLDSKKEEVTAIVQANYQSMYSDRVGISILNEVVESAFNVPYQFESANKERVAEKFEGAGYVVCLARLNENK